MNEGFGVDSTGLGSFDAAGAGDAIPTLFDDYDDPFLVDRFVRGWDAKLTPEEQAANRDLMVELGVYDIAPKMASGYAVNVQPAFRLLGGGISHNRAAILELNRRLRKGDP